MAVTTLDPVAEAAPRPKDPPGLWTLFRTHSRRILFTYGLFTLENALRLSQPFVLGLAIDDLLRSSHAGLALLIGQLLGFMLVGSLRRAYDVRAFNGIYTELASRLVLDQRGRDVDVSRVAARSVLSRAFVDFFERDVPNLLQSVYSAAGAFVMLGFYDRALPLFCLALVPPVCALNFVYGRRTFFLNRRLNDQMEREVGVISGGRPEEVREHFRRAAHWRVRLTDWGALNFGLTEVFVLALVAASLLRVCSTPGTGAGDIFAVFRYLMLFLMGLDGAPDLVQQLGRLRDIAARMRAGRGP